MAETIEHKFQQLRLGGQRLVRRFLPHRSDAKGRAGAAEEEPPTEESPLLPRPSNSGGNIHVNHISSIQLGRWGTLLTSDAVLSVAGVATFLLIARFLLPNNHLLWWGLAGWLTAFLLGYWAGRWQMTHQQLVHKKVAADVPLDHREALRPRRRIALPGHTLLSRFVQRPLRFHPAPLRSLSTRVRAWTLLGSPSAVSTVEDSPTLEVIDEEAGFSSDGTPPQATTPHQFGRISLLRPPSAGTKMPPKYTDVTPLCILQGMDIFIADTPVEQVGSHPAFVAAGLRNQPMLIINALTHVGNLVLYLELPAWTRNLDDPVGNADRDSPAAARLRRFLTTATDAQRSKALRLATSLEEGPLPVQALAPRDPTPFGVVGAINPGVWHVHAPTDGLAPAWEVGVDLASARFLRTGISIARRNLHTLVLDCALLLGNDRPDNNEDDILLGLFRVNRVNMMDSPEFPIAPTAQDDLQLAQRASLMIQQDAQLAMAVQAS